MDKPKFGLVGEPGAFARGGGVGRDPMTLTSLFGSTEDQSAEDRVIDARITEDLVANACITEDDVAEEADAEDGVAEDGVAEDVDAEDVGAEYRETENTDVDEGPKIPPTTRLERSVLETQHRDVIVSPRRCVLGDGDSDADIFEIPAWLAGSENHRIQSEEGTRDSCRFRCS